MSSPSSLNPQAGRPSNSLHFVVGEINGKLDHLLAYVIPSITDLDKRVVVLEKRSWTQSGAIAIVVLILSSWEVVRCVFSI